MRIREGYLVKKVRGGFGQRGRELTEWVVGLWVNVLWFQLLKQKRCLFFFFFPIFLKNKANEPIP